MKVAVVGAGISGSAFAHWLSAARVASGLPIEVTLFDKARRPGGRASSHASPREMSWEADLGLSFLDFSGAQELLSTGSDLSLETDKLLRHQLHTWISEGALIPVGSASSDHRRSMRIERLTASRWVAPRGFGVFTDLITATSPQVTRRLSHHIHALTLTPSGSHRAPTWSLSGLVSPHKASFTERGFDLLVVTAPPPQSAALLKESAPQVAERLDHTPIFPQWVTRIRGELSWLPAPIFECESDVIAQISDEGAKRGVDQTQSNALYCVHARPDWSQRHLEKTADEVSELLLEALREIGHQLNPLARTEVSIERTHRWKYSRALASAGIDGALAELDLERSLGVCGDSYAGGDGIGALRSAAELVTLICAQWGGTPSAVSASCDT